MNNLEPNIQISINQDLLNSMWDNFSYPHTLITVAPPTVNIPGSVIGGKDMYFEVEEEKITSIEIQQDIVQKIADINNLLKQSESAQISDSNIIKEINEYRNEISKLVVEEKCKTVIKYLDVEKLRLFILSKPNIEISESGISINNISVGIDFKIIVYYKAIFSSHVTITSNDDFELQSNIILALENYKGSIRLIPKFSRLKLVIKFSGIKITIDLLKLMSNLTKIDPILICDTSKLSIPINVISNTISIKDIKITTLQKKLNLDLFFNYSNI